MADDATQEQPTTTAPAPTPEQPNTKALEKKIADQDRKLAQQEKTIENQKAQLENNKQEIAKLKSTVGEKVENIRTLQGEAEANQAIIEQQERQLAVGKVAAQGGKPVVEHNGHHYRVLVGKLHLDGAVVTAAELAASPQLVAKLVADGSGALQLVEAEG